MSRDRVFNRLRPPLLRKRIPPAETTATLLTSVALVLIVAWVATRRDKYDPAERDVSMAVLEQQSVEDRLYKTPLKPWVKPEPGAAPVGAGPQLGVFPAAILDAGWRLQGRLREFEPHNLFEKINGAAEQYIRYGFQKLHYLVLSGPEGELSLELYDQGNFANSLGMFATQRDPSRKVEREGAVYFYRTGLGAIGIVSRYFFKIVGDTEAQALRAKAVSVVRAFDELVEGPDAVPAGFRVLHDTLDIPVHEIAYVPSNAFDYDFARKFWFGRPEAGNKARVFVHNASSAREARTLFARILEEHGYEHTALEQSNDGALMKHEFLDTYFAMRLHGRLIYGVEQAGKRQMVARLLPLLAKGFTS